MKVVFKITYIGQFFLLFSLFFILFMSFIIFFGTIHRSYCTISTNI